VASLIRLPRITDYARSCVDSILVLADELERLDADAAVRLDDVEARQREVDGIRHAATEAEAQLRWLPVLRRTQEHDEAAAFEARAQAVTAVREGEEQVARARDSDRASTERRLDDARAALHAVEREIEYLQQRRAALHDEEEEALRQVASAGERALTLGAELDLSGAADVVIGAVGEWAARERGALIVEHSNLVRERDAVIREASELLASVLGDAMVLTSVAGLRARLEQALTS
jgi:chromosome segregation ATPase